MHWLTNINGSKSLDLLLADPAIFSCEGSQIYVRKCRFFRDHQDILPFIGAGSVVEGGEEVLEAFWFHVKVGLQLGCCLVKCLTAAGCM